MKVLIVALLALAVSADNYGHTKHYSYSPYHSYGYGDYDHAYPYSYGGHGLSYGSALYGTPYYGYGQNAYKSVYGLGGAGQTYYTGADQGSYQVAAVRPKAYRPARFPGGFFSGSENFENNNERLYSAGGAPGRISFTKDFSTISGRFSQSRPGISPTVSGFNKFEAPVVPVVPQQTRKQAGFVDTAQKTEIHDFNIPSRPAGISFTKDVPDFPRSSGTRGSSVKTAGSNDDKFSEHGLSDVFHENDEDESLDNKDRDHSSNTGGFSRGSFSQDSFGKSGSSRQHSSGTKSEASRFDRDEVEDTLNIDEHSNGNSDDHEESSRKGVHDFSSPKSSFPRDFSGAPRASGRDSNEESESGFDRDEAHDLTDDTEHSKEDTDDLKSEHRDFSTTGGAGKTTFTQDFSGVSRTSSQHGSGIKTVVPTFDDDVPHDGISGISDRHSSKNTGGYPKTDVRGFSTTRVPGKRPFQQGFSGASASSAVRPGSFDKFGNPAVSGIKSSHAYEVTKQQTSYPTFPARTVPVAKTITRSNIAPIILSPVEGYIHDHGIISTGVAPHFEDSVLNVAPEPSSDVSLVPVPDSYISDDQSGYSYFGDSPVFSTRHGNNLLYTYSSPYVLSPFSYTPVKGVRQDAHVEQKTIK